MYKKTLDFKDQYDFWTMFFDRIDMFRFETIGCEVNLTFLNAELCIVLSVKRNVHKCKKCLY